MNITYFHRNKNAGYSIDKVTQTIIRQIEDKRELYLPCRRASIIDLIKNIIFVLKHRNNKGINHVTGDVHYCILALIGCKSVLTIHDTVSVDFCCQSNIKKIYHRWFWFKLPLMLATKVICISESTKRMLEKYTNRKDIVVIHNAIDPSFVTEPKDISKRPYNVLIIGTGPNKNLERTVKALANIKCKLTIIGSLTQEQKQLLEDKNMEYDNKHDLTDEEILNEYIQCDIVSFISLYEGFGMPVIEAQMTGRPVITSTLPVLKEVGGKGAVFVDPKDVEDMRNGFERLFLDAELRKQCVSHGLENVKRFEATEIVKQYLKVYNSIA